MVHHQMTAFFRLHKSSTVSMIKNTHAFFILQKTKNRSVYSKRCRIKSFNKTPTGEFKATVSDLNMSHYQAACLVISNKMGDGAAAASVWF